MMRILDFNSAGHNNMGGIMRSLLQMLGILKKKESPKDDFRAYIKIISEKKLPPGAYHSWSAGGIAQIQRINLDENFLKKPEEIQQEEILTLCRNHFTDNVGTIGKSFGRIMSYRYFYSENEYREVKIDDLQ
jgi:hypothetical protein